MSIVKDLATVISIIVSTITLAGVYYSDNGEVEKRKKNIFVTSFMGRLTVMTPWWIKSRSKVWMSGCPSSIQTQNTTFVFQRL